MGWLMQFEPRRRGRILSSYWSRGGHVTGFSTYISMSFRYQIHSYTRIWSVCFFACKFSSKKGIKGMVKKLRHEQFTEKQISYTAIMQWHELCYCVDIYYNKQVQLPCELWPWALNCKHVVAWTDFRSSLLGHRIWSWTHDVLLDQGVQGIVFYRMLVPILFILPTKYEYLFIIKRVLDQLKGYIFLNGNV